MKQVKINSDFFTLNGINNNILKALNSKNETLMLLENHKSTNIIINKPINILLLEYISLTKILASFSVVILHTNSCFWNFTYQNYKEFWISANIIESTFFFAVPAFFLCIGATLLNFNEKYGLKKYYYRRITKVVLPLICWNILLYFFRVYIIKNMKKIDFNIISIWNLYYGLKKLFYFCLISPIYISIYDNSFVGLC